MSEPDRNADCPGKRGKFLKQLIHFLSEYYSYSGVQRKEMHMKKWTAAILSLFLCLNLCGMAVHAENENEETGMETESLHEETEQPQEITETVSPDPAEEENQETEESVPEETPASSEPLEEESEALNMEDPEKRTIVRFQELSETVVHKDTKPALEEATADMPQKLSALVKSSEGETWEEVAVSWHCVNPYETENAMYDFQPEAKDFLIASEAALPTICLIIGDPSDYEESGGTWLSQEDLLEGDGFSQGYSALEAELPQSYSFRGALPPIRNQGPYGTCWVFAAIGAVEADLIHDGSADQTIDLSEGQFAYFTSHDYQDPKNNHKGDTVRYSRSDSYLNASGNLHIALHAFSDMVGPVYEDEVPYQEYSTLDDKYAVSSNRYRVTGASYLRMSDRARVKQAIMDHGSVHVSMYINRYYYNSFNNCYISNQKNSNHSVLLVGWDDHFSKENFTSSLRPENDGAWLVRNSYGTQGDGYGGYFWISYEDACMQSQYYVTCAYDADTALNDYCYSYDGSFFGGGTWRGTKKNSLVVTQSYTIDADEEVRTVGLCTFTENLDAVITLSDGINTVSQSVSLSDMGFRMVDLDTPLPAGDRREVIATVTYTAKDGNGIKVSEEPVVKNKSKFGRTWSAAMSGPGYQFNGFTNRNDLRMKLYTNRTDSATHVSSVSLNYSEMALERGEEYQLQAVVLPENASNKKIIWKSSDERIAVVDENGMVKAVSAGTAVITAASEDGHRTATCNVGVCVSVTGLKLLQNRLVLTENSSDQLNAVLSPSDATNTGVMFTSSKEDVATVDPEGRVTAHSAGSAEITAESSDGHFKAVCAVTVVKNGISIQGLEESYPYTGRAVRPSAAVYDSGKLLSEGKDYTLSYQNNTKAGTASLIIQGKGTYREKKTVLFDIVPSSIAEASVQEITLVQKKNATPLTAKPKVTWNGITLKENRDYTVDYGTWDRMEAGEHEIVLQGMGNFNGEKTVTVYVASASLVPVSKWKVSCGKIVYDEDLTFEKILNSLTVRYGGKNLEREVDYTVSDPKDCDRAGTCTFVLSGIGSSWYGNRTVSVRISGTSLNSVKVQGYAVYDGQRKTLSNSPDIYLTVKGQQLKEGTDYRVLADTYENNLNAGKATAVIEGINGYTGKKKITFRILPDTTERAVEVSDAVYTKNGAVPYVEISGLREGTDYRLSCSNNRQVTTADVKKLPEVKITFLGNYKGTPDVRVNYQIYPETLSNTFVTAPDIVFTNAEGNYKSKITVADYLGKTLKAGTDYDKNIIYQDADGNVLPDNALLNPKEAVTAVLTGIGNYTGTAEVTYHIDQNAKDLSKAVIRVNNQEYTGYDPGITEEDILTAYMKEGRITVPLRYGEDFELCYCENGIDPGRARAVFIGKGKYSGTKSVSFRIVRRSVVNNWAEEILGFLGF